MKELHEHFNDANAEVLRVNGSEIKTGPGSGMGHLLELQAFAIYMLHANLYRAAMDELISHEAYTQLSEVLPQEFLTVPAKLMKWLEQNDKRIQTMVKG